MPEGDTIHKIANFLAPRMVGERVHKITLAPRFPRRPFAGDTVRSVEAHGKHLYIGFAGGPALRSHLGMYGSWHFYAPDAHWQKPANQASLILATEHTDYVCFNAKEVEWVRRPSVRGRILDQRLGPDLTTGQVDTRAVVRRARDLLEPATPLIDVLLDQRVACGIGNVYKSELLFIQRHRPLLPLMAISDADLAASFALAAELLASNLGGGKRVTRRENDGAGRLWVYARQGAPCLRCEHPIEYARLGQHHRGTYWCPRCQP